MPPTAVVIHETGGPEVLKLEPVEIGRPKAGELRIRQTAIGVNFHDIYVRSGLYRTLTLPGIPGVEATGIVEEIGTCVTGFSLGDRVAYTTPNYGAYAQERLISAKDAVVLPDAVGDRLAAAVMVKGMTAQLLVRRVHPVRRGEWMLVHAAAGGVGRLLCQWGRHLGATVVGTVGSDEKAEVARRCGCHFVIHYRRENFVDRVLEFTSGRGVDVAYDSVGKDTFFGSLDALAFFGHLVHFGQSSGPVDPFPVSLLSTKSTTVTRPMCFHYVADRAILDETAAELFHALAEGIVSVENIQHYPLYDVAQAHRDLEGRLTVGSMILVP
jgi:NADPH2:quinone reductase